jgi:Ca2+-binding EF-hand superfamily protein
LDKIREAASKRYAELRKKNDVAAELERKLQDIDKDNNGVVTRDELAE